MFPPRGKAEPCCELLCLATGRDHSNTTGTSPELRLHAWLLLGGPSQETSGGLLQQVSARVGEGEREVRDRDGKSKKEHLRKDLGDKLLEDRLQMVCTYITCFDLEALLYVVLN